MSEAKNRISVEEFWKRIEHDRDFFFEKFVKIRPKKGGALVPLIMRPAQRRLMNIIDEARARGVRPQVVILKARQIGFSTVVAAEFFRRALIYHHRQTLVAAHKAEAVEGLFNRIRLMHAKLPAKVRPKNVADTKRLMHFEEQDSRIEVAIANEARSFTAQDLHISELAFYANASTFMTSALETCPDEPEATIIVESTPNGIGNEFHDLWVRASRPGSNSSWIPFFVPWFDEPTYVKTPWFTREELFSRGDDAALRAQEIMTAHDLSLAQIAWWLDHLENTHFGDLDSMEQEMASDPRSCFLSSGRAVFDRKGLKHFMSLAGIDPDSASGPDLHADDSRDYELIENPLSRKHTRKERQRRGPWRIYRDPMPRHNYIIGADISAGDSGSDYSPLVVLNQHTLNVDAVRYTRTPPERLALEATIAGYWYNDAKIAGEANNQGISFNRELERLEYPNIYRRKVTEQTIAAKATTRPGFWTSGENRHLLFNMVRRYVASCAGIVEDERMVWEWSQLLFKEGTDEIDHPENGFSDLTLAFGIALAVHAGAWNALLQPLSLEHQSAAVSALESVRAAKSMGLSDAAALAELEVFGLTIDEVDAIHASLEKRAERLSRTGARGAV